MHVGIDMIYASVRPDGYRIKDASCFQHSPSVKKKYGDEVDIWGYSANDEPLDGRLFVNRGKGGYEATVNIDRRGLQVQFNPSKMKHAYLLTADIDSQVEVVKSMLSELMVDVDIDRATLTRLDLTKQAILPTPVETFSGAFAAINGKRMKDSKQYQTAFEIGNTLRRMLFYDKHIEQLQYDQNTTVPRNMLRAEYTFNKQAITTGSNSLQIGSIYDLRKSDVEYLTSQYNRNVLDSIFRTRNGVQLSFDYANEYDVLKSLSDQHGCTISTFRHAALLLSIQDIALLNNANALKAMLKQIGYHQRTIYRILTELNELTSQKRFIDNARGKRDSTAAQLDVLIKSFASWNHT